MTAARELRVRARQLRVRPNERSETLTLETLEPVLLEPSKCVLPLVTKVFFHSNKQSSAHCAKSRTFCFPTVQVLCQHCLLTEGKLTTQETSLKPPLSAREGRVDDISGPIRRAAVHKSHGRTWSVCVGRLALLLLQQTSREGCCKRMPDQR